MHRLCALLLLGLAAAFLTAGAAHAAPTIKYQWDAAQWLATYPTGQFSASAITNPDGTTGAQITVITPSNPWNYIFVHGAGLTGGNQYSAVLNFSPAAQTSFPSSFQLFARNSAGTQYDILQEFAGLPGPTRQIVLPLDLPVVSGGSWSINLLIHYGGAMNLNSFVIYNGLSSDGLQNYTWRTPTLNGTPVAPVVPGVTEATGYTAFAITAPATTGAVVTPALTADYAGAPLSVAQTNATLLQSALNSVAIGGKILLTPGVYRVAPTATFAFGSPGVPKFDVTIDGQGSTLIMESLLSNSQMFTLSNCNRMVMKNLTLDWDQNVKPIASLGVVSNISGNSCDFTFNSSLTTAQINLIKTTPWKSLLRFNPTKLVAIDNYAYAPPSGTPTLTVGSSPNILHAVFSANPKLINGATYAIRHLYYEMSAFKISACTHLSFNNFIINGMPGMGWTWQDRTHHFQLYNCKITRSTAGANNPFTTAADGVHGNESQGYIDIENCTFTGTGDDIMNIHDSIYQWSVTQLSSTSIRLSNCFDYNIRLANGDPIEFYNEDFSNLGGSPTTVSLPVQSFTTHNGSTPPYVDIVFGSTLPAGITNQSIIRNGAFNTSNVRITGNSLQYSSARGILLSADNATVGSNYIRGLWSAPLELEMQVKPSLWEEGKGNSNVLIKSNTIEDCNGSNRYRGSYICANAQIPYGQTQATVYDKISIESNVFYDCPGPALILNNCANILVKNNQMRMGVIPANLSVYSSAFMVTNSVDLALGGNQWINIVPCSAQYGVIWDPATVSNIEPDTNSLTNTY